MTEIYLYTPFEWIIWNEAAAISTKIHSQKDYGLMTQKDVAVFNVLSV